jgi:hypothetical protein
MKSGRSQDGDRVELDPEKGLELDLRDIVRAGGNLNATHCSKLRVLSSLRSLIAATARPTHGSNTRWPRRLTGLQPSPLEIRTTIEAGINKLQRSDADELKKYAEVLKLLFGFTPRTTGKNAKIRRLAAMAYWEEHANFHGHDATEKNFNRKIVEKYLYPPLVQALLQMESQFQLEASRASADRDLTPSSSGISIAARWSEEYCRLFRYELIMSEMASQLELFLQWRSRSKIKLGSRWKTADIPVEGIPSIWGRYIPINSRMATDAMWNALYHVGLIWHLIKAEGWKPIPLEAFPVRWSQSILNDCIASFVKRFELGRPDHEWLDHWIREEGPVMITLYLISEATRSNLVDDIFKHPYKYTRH